MDKSISSDDIKPAGNPELPKITWERSNNRTLTGFVGGERICVISTHWSGVWLDGFGVPAKCENEENAKAVAVRALHGLMSAVFSTFCGDDKYNAVCMPKEWTWAEINRQSHLPFVYIWNENPQLGTFTVSINGEAVATELEMYIARSEISFNAVCNEIMRVLQPMVTASVVSVCNRLRCMPSAAFLAWQPVESNVLIDTNS